MLQNLEKADAGKIDVGGSNRPKTDAHRGRRAADQIHSWNSLRAVVETPVGPGKLIQLWILRRSRELLAREDRSPDLNVANGFGRHF